MEKHTSTYKRRKKINTVKQAIEKKMVFYALRIGYKHISLGEFNEPLNAKRLARTIFVHFDCDLIILTRRLLSSHSSSFK